MSELSPTPKALAHNQAAPYWAVAMLGCALIGISTVFVSSPGFWNAYVLDITGPAWNYVLFRGLAYSYADNVWTRFFTPTKTFLLFVLFVYGVEFAQYLELYDSTFDPWDLVAYVSILLPMYLVDIRKR